MVEFDANNCFVKDKLTRKLLLEGRLKDGLYQLSGVTSHGSHAYISVKESWHRKLGHPSSRVLNEILKSCNVRVPQDDHFSFCEACQFGKMHYLPFRNSFSHAQEHLELIHIDVWDPAPIN